MSDKETKVPVYLVIIVALLLVAGAGYYVLGKSSPLALSSAGNPNTENTQVPTSTETSKPPEVTPTTSATSAATSVQSSSTAGPVQAQPVETIKCELCHTNPQDINQHVNGGKLCINCHGSQVHNIHIGPGTVGLNCDTCHGFPPKIPTVQKGEGPGSYSVCEQCHAAPPDSLKPSKGNLIVIHLSRGKYCTNCHGTDIGTIHAAALGNLTNRTK